MTPAIKNSVYTGITLAHATAILGREASVIDSLVRRDKLVPVRGKAGRGGEYRVGRDSLVMLDAAARLKELHVPRRAIKRLMGRLRTQLDTEGELAIVYAPHKEDVVALREGESMLRELIGGGATVELVEPRRAGAEFERRLLLEEAPRGRGRPKLDREWTRKKLDSAADLGDDETSPDELSRVIGDRGTPPWRRDS